MEGDLVDDGGAYDDVQSTRLHRITQSLKMCGYDHPLHLDQSINLILAAEI